MEYTGLTEDEMLDIVIEARREMQNERTKLENKLRDLGIRQEEITKRMQYFDDSFVMFRLIAENNRRIAANFEEEFDIRKKDLFL
jgi:hypothetical protein